MLSKPQFVGERVRLGDCFPYIKNGYNSRQGKDKGGVPITRIETLSDNKFNRNKVGYANIFSTEGLEKHVLEDGDILMSHINSLPYLGRSVMYRARPGEVFIHGMNLLRLKADRSIVEPEYAELYFRSPRFKQQVSKIAKKAVNQASFSVSNLKELEFPLMSLCDQRDVIKKLSFITAQIEYNQKAIGELSLLVKSRFVEMFGDPIENPFDWRTKPLSNLGNLKNGVNFKSVDSGTKIRCLSVSDFKDCYQISNMELISYVSLNNKPNKTQLLRDGDVVFVRSNGNKRLVGRCLAIFPGDEDVTFSGFCIRFHNESNELLLDYLLGCLKSDSMRKAMTGRGANIQNLSQKILSEVVLPIPPLTLQQEFATFVQHVDKSRFISMSRYRDILIKNGYRHPHLQGFNR